MGVEAGRPFGAGARRESYVFLVRAGHDDAVVEADGRSDAEFRIRGIAAGGRFAGFVD